VLPNGIYDHYGQMKMEKSQKTADTFFADNDRRELGCLLCFYYFKK